MEIQEVRDWLIVSILVVAIFSFMFSSATNASFIDSAADSCGGLEKLQWVSFDSLGFNKGYGCMPK